MIREIQNLDLSQYPHVTLSLLSRDGTTGRRSGLNWGQRPGRHPDQAYIRVSKRIDEMGFFPNIGVRFRIITDNRRNLICVRAQQDGKAIETCDENSQMGAYFRRRLGVNLGEFVTRENLEDYGRTNVDFYRIDEETYYMDFSVEESPNEPNL